MTCDIAYREVGTGSPVVFLHGVGGAATSWQFQLEEFSKTHRAIAWDAPGYGGSVPIEPLTFEALAAALIHLLDDLEVYDAHIVGLSMGGMVAQEVAASYPNRVRSLVLSATSPAFGPLDGEFQKNFVAARFAPLDAGKSMPELAAGVANMFGPDANPNGIEVAVRAMAATSEASYRASIACLVTFDRRDALPDIRVPTLVLAGETDENAPAPMMERMAAKIPGAQFICLTGAGHLANQEFPRRYNDVLREFLAEIGDDR